MQTAIAEEVLSDSADSPQSGSKKRGALRIEGPIAAVAFLDKAAAYVGLTRQALATALRRGEMPGHKKRKNPEDESSGGDWIFNVKAWDELADVLPEMEPPEWHHWKDYWTYNRGTRKFQQVKKEDCMKVKGKRVYKPRKSRLEQADNL
ncbi:TPA: transcriptional regulator [Salmonella enterica subsp. salamae serovar 28:r:e,n,z15]|nr:transcriptional regulator [Salmonella enterica subsp. salamae serovar 28:r:e,n,z15]